MKTRTARAPTRASTSGLALHARGLARRTGEHEVDGLLGSGGRHLRPRIGGIRAR